MPDAGANSHFVFQPQSPDPSSRSLLPRTTPHGGDLVTQRYQRSAKRFFVPWSLGLTDMRGGRTRWRATSSSSWCQTLS